MAHIYFARKGHMTCGKIRIVQLFFREPCKLSVYVAENFLDGTASQPAFAEHEFFARRGLHFHAGQPRTFLSSVVLLFHQQVQLVQAIHPCTVFFLVVAERFEQAYHGDATFMFERFHLLCKK